MKIKLMVLPLTALFMACTPDIKLPDVEYKTMTVKKEDVTLHYSFSASLRGQQDVDIVPQASGTLTAIHVKPGQKVTKGQTMFIIDQVPSQAELRVANADLKVAKAQAATAKIELESKKDLYNKHVVSDIQVKKAENQYATALASIEQAEARVTNASQNLSFTVVKAPCDGIVGDLGYRVGALVGPNIMTPLTVVSNNDNVYAYVSLTERDLLTFFSEKKDMTVDEALKKLPKVQLRTSIGEIYDEEGTIESLSGVINRTTGTMTVRAIFPNPNGILRSGGAAAVVVPMECKGVLVIPQEATTSMQDRVMAYKVVDNKAKAVQVQVIPTDDNMNFIVTDGLKEGDVIIAEGAGNVKEGEEVSFEQKLE
ncbi:MAG: efflux RND transporter periplasmic adaptor subunit [Bacteroidaceae bacterium]|nr:efflux RND transporter periplasmic adaptor subunit [Bacteroidaceae bacterium]